MLDQRSFLADVRHDLAPIKTLMKKQYKKQEKAKQVWILLDQTDLNKIKQKCNEKKLSMSTLARLLEQNCILTKENKEILTKDYINKKPMKQSTIKPRHQMYIHEKKELTKLYSNLLHLWINKKLKTMYENEPKLYERITNKLNKDIELEKEAFWDLNNIIRSTARANKILGVK